MRALILHAYSADNAGDGLLVAEAIGMVREAFGAGTELTLVASRPSSFSDLGIPVVDSSLHRYGYNGHYLRHLLKFDRYDLIIGVGGGYLRSGFLKEFVKCALIHGPQLLASSRRGAGVVYLPQSIGPLRRGTRRIVERMLEKIEVVMVRDGRSFDEVRKAQPRRFPDLALMSVHINSRDGLAPDPTPVLSVRAVRGVIPRTARGVATVLGSFDGYVQSRTGSNDDLRPMCELGPGRLISRSELLTDVDSPRRVVIAVRLHAALMALNAGHLVVHLAYERKGFGAFEDLGLAEYVHNAFTGDKDLIAWQVKTLMTDPKAREKYESTVNESRVALAKQRAELVDLLRCVGGHTDGNKA